jgi:hypothetical protein
MRLSFIKNIRPVVIVAASTAAASEPWLDEVFPKLCSVVRNAIAES